MICKDEQKHGKEKYREVIGILDVSVNAKAVYVAARESRLSIKYLQAVMEKAHQWSSKRSYIGTWLNQ